MSPKEVSKKWKEQATEDLGWSKSSLIKKGYLNTLFFCHQAIEKALKGYYIYKIGDDYPYTHDLSRLLKEIIDYLSDVEEEFLELCEELNPFYMVARYPDYKENLRKKAQEAYTKQIQKKTTRYVNWLIQKIK